MHTSVTRRLVAAGPSRTVAAVIVTAIVCSAATAGAAALITGNDVKNGSLTGKDIKDGSLAKGDLDGKVRNAIAIRVTGGLPTQTFTASDASVKNTKDGVEFGPYPDGGAAGGSLCTTSLKGDPFSSVKHLAYEASYAATGSTGGIGVPYLRVFLENNNHDAIFSPNTQAPDADTAEGPFHTWVATAGSWRYDDDAGTGPDSPFADIRDAHATEKITKICVSVGNSAGTNLSGLLRTLEVNSKDYSFGL